MRPFRCMSMMESAHDGARPNSQLYKRDATRLMSRILLLAAVFADAVVAPEPPPLPPATIRIDPRALSVTDATFASWNIDSSCNRGFHRIHFSNPNLHLAAHALGPSKMRFGGSGNDYLVYGLSPDSSECAAIPPSTSCSYFTQGCLNASHWESLYEFAHSSNAHLVFGLSFGLDAACAQGQSYAWNATNAATLLAYMRRRGQKVYGFELGNELNNHGGPPCNLSASQQADAFKTLHGMLQDTQPDAKLIGPDTGYKAAKDWLAAFLPLVADKLDAVTHHVYPGIHRGSFNQPATLNSTLPEIQWYTRLISEYAPEAQVWACEDGPIGGGDDGTCGKVRRCATYASALWYADDMGLALSMGLCSTSGRILLVGTMAWSARPPHTNRPH